MPQKIFIIEDDANILYGLQAKLNIAGFEIDVDNGSSSIEEIVHKIRKNPPNYIILDLVLPKLDGFEVIKELNKYEETLDIPIFVFTNMGDSDSREKGEEMGVKHYFLKDSISVDNFVEKVVRIIKNKEK